jgi:hypothetical protein
MCALTQAGRTLEVGVPAHSGVGAHFRAGQESAAQVA